MQNNDIHSHRARHVVEVITHGDKQIKEQFPAGLHLHLHRAASLEGGATADDEGQVMGAQLGVGIGRVGVSVPRTGQDRAALNARLQPLFSQRQSLEFFESVFLGGAIHDGIFQDRPRDGVEIHRRLARPAILEFPGLASLAVADPRVVVPFIEILEHRREDLRFFVGEVDSTGMRFLKLSSTGRREEGRVAEHVLVGSEQTLLPTADDGDDGGCEIT